jgi:hypothetical protein
MITKKQPSLSTNSIQKKPLFSLIYVNFNSSDDLLLSLKSFIKVHSSSKIIFEIIVVDNCSSITEKKKLQKFSSLFNSNKFSLRLFFSPTNLGFGGANNFAAKQSRGEHLLFLNPDTLCKQEFLVSFLPVLSQKNTGFIAPQLILPSHAPQLFAYGKFPTLKNTLLGKINQLQPYLAQNASLVKVDWLSAACFAVSKEKFLQLGGFSPVFFMYFEDVDLCRKAAEKHYQQLLLPQLQVIHFGGARSQLTRARRRLYFAAQKQYFCQWLPFQLPLLLFLRFPYQLYCYFKDKPNLS